MARSRLLSLKRRLLKNPQLHAKYNAGIQQYIDKEHARILSEMEVSEDSSKLWYLPHHPVINTEKPDKVRIVFDCVARFNGKSLNKFLYSGPDVTSSLLGVLLRFRRKQVALVGDIEGMFNQIRTLPSDTRKLSFLWWPEGNLSFDPVTYQMLVHIFGATSSPFCANYCLRRTATDNAELYDKSTVQAVLRAFYVDDCLASVDTVSEAIAMREQLSSLLSRGGFHITKWKSNSRDVIKSIPKKELASSVESMNLELTELPIDGALGIVWDMDKDIISFKWKERARPFTKRGILSIISSVYDPLGIVSPFLLQAKIMLQKLMRKGLGLDDPVPDHYREQWNAWQRDLPLMSNVHIERCIKPVIFGEVANVQLHHFSDASSVGYGCVSYIRLEDAEGRVCCSFLLGKSRLCPIKSVSIPRLELTAATLSVKVNSIIIRELDMNINAVYFWTDPTTVLKYINNKTKRFHTFVANRIALIQSGSSTNQWKHVDSANNPADKATRSVTPKDFQPPSL